MEFRITGYVSVTSAWRDPYEGWVDSYAGITGLFMECGRGTLRSVVCNPKCVMDLIPVDVVANTIIAATWQTSLNRFTIPLISLFLMIFLNVLGLRR